MTPEQHELLREAADSIAAARLLRDGGYPAYAVARAYYAMFYVAEAFLEDMGLSFSKHSAVIGAFGTHVARPGRVPLQFHRYLLDAYRLRQVADYGGSQQVTGEQASVQIDRADQLLSLAQRLLKPGA